jgi:hypothetical protein
MMAMAVGGMEIGGSTRITAPIARIAATEATLPFLAGMRRRFGTVTAGSSADGKAMATTGKNGSATTEGTA